MRRVTKRFRAVSALGLAFALTFAAAGPLLKSGVADSADPSQELRDVYLPDTAFSAPAVAMRVDSEEDLALAKAEKRASVALMRLNENLSVVGENGEELFPAEEVYEDSGVGEGIVPAYIVDESSAAAAEQYLSEKNILDGLVFSEDAEIVSKIRAGAPDMSGGLLSDGTEGAKELAATAGESSARVAAVPASRLTKEYVNEMHLRWVAVWADCEDESDVYRALAAGADGIISEEPTETIELLESLPAGIFREPLLQAHRGVPDLAQENTISGARLAEESGAENMELDVFRTKDGQLAVIHDGGLDNLTDGTGAVGDYTLDELKEMHVDVNPYVSPEPVCSLEDFFHEFADTDFTFSIEIKEWIGVEIIDPLKALIEKYDMSDRVMIISFEQDQVVRAKREMPEIPVLWLSGSVSSDLGTDEYVRKVIETCNRTDLNMINSADANVTDEQRAALAARGILTSVGTYTLGGYGEYREKFTDGAYMVSSNDVTVTADMPVALEPLTEEMRIGTSEREAEAAYAYVVTKSGYLLNESGERVIAECEPFTGDEEIVCGPAGWYATEIGAYGAALRWKTPFGYYVYSDYVDVSALPREGIAIDYTAETLIFDESALEVSPNVSFSEKLASGDNVTPGGTLYVRAAGASEGSSFAFRIPSRPAAPKASAQVDGSRVILTGGTQFSLFGGVWSDSGVYGGLKTGTEYSFLVRLAATETSFTSEPAVVKVQI